MKKQLWLAGIGMVLASSSWAQETCHWNNLRQRYYRVVGDYGSRIESIFLADGAFAWSNDEVGGGAVIEAALDMARSNWISQEHHRITGMVEFQLVEPTDPACIARTGQAISYHAGDDGELQPGHSWPDRFTIQANTNLVVDNLTGLMWLRNATVGTGTWNIAVGACYFPPYFEFDDWRLPSVREMESLIDVNFALPALPLPHPFQNLSLNYWTSTWDASDTNKAWVVSIGDGTVARWARTNGTPAYWPVRTHTSGKSPVPRTGQTNSLTPGDDGDLQPGTPWPIPRFTVMADTNLVFDNLWGRMWTRQVGIGATTSWAPAIDHCAAMTLGEHADWRLPTRREAWSLIDFGRTNFLPVGHPFEGSPEVPFWTSSTYRPLTNYAWGISGGYLGAYIKTAIGGGVWPVRGNW